MHFSLVSHRFSCDVFVFVAMFSKLKLPDEKRKVFAIQLILKINFYSVYLYQHFMNFISEIDLFSFYFIARSILKLKLYYILFSYNCIIIIKKFISVCINYNLTCACNSFRIFVAPIFIKSSNDIKM